MSSQLLKRIVRKILSPVWYWCQEPFNLPDLIDRIDIPIGSMITVSINWQPREGEFVEPDGRLLNRYLYSELFELIGYKYGGHEYTWDFRIPDIRSFQDISSPPTTKTLIKIK